MAEAKSPVQKQVTSDAGYRRTPDEAELALIYGPVGSGKTFALLRAAPNFLWVVSPGGIKPYRQALGGYKPETITVTNWGIEQFTQLLSQVAGRKNSYGMPFDGVVIDDGSLIAEVTYGQAKARVGGGGMSYHQWEELKQLFIRFRQEARACGLHVFSNFHEKAPEERDGHFTRGGPLLPVRQLIESIPATFDFVARATVEPGGVSALTRDFSVPDHWPGIFIVDRCEAQWVTKDRDGVAPPRGPMNLRQILLLAGYTLSLPPGLEFFDDVIPKVAEAFAFGAVDGRALNQDVATFVADKLKGQPNFDSARILACIDWALSDIRDRAMLLRYNANKLAKYGVQVTL